MSNQNLKEEKSMKEILIFLGVSMLIGSSPILDTRPVSTYSIVAYDEDAGQFGVAVQSHWFSVGSVVP